MVGAGLRAADTPSDTWAIERGPGGACARNAADLPNAPAFDAGTVSPIAGTKSPLVVNLRREDGTQQFSSVTLTPPQGLVGKLAGIPYCSDSALTEAAAKSGRAEEASSSCPQASYVGSVSAAAGAGPTPYYAPGKAYLTGPYKGARSSLAIVTPATAGPFDLGTIVVRTALYIDRRDHSDNRGLRPDPLDLEGDTARRARGSGENGSPGFHAQPEQLRSLHFRRPADDHAGSDDATAEPLSGR